MTTYAKRPPQSSRLSQNAQKRQSTVSAPSIDPVIDGDRLSGTTFSPSGAMVPAIRLSLAEQSSGLDGKSSNRQAPSNTSAAVASGKTCISTPYELHHGAAQSPGESTAKLGSTVNLHRRRLSAFGGFGGQIVWPRVAGIAAILTPWALAALIGWVMSVWL